MLGHIDRKGCVTMLRRIPGTHRIRHAGRTAAAAKQTCVALEWMGYSIALLLNKAVSQD
jgi:hypothetical protein